MKKMILGALAALCTFAVGYADEKTDSVEKFKFTDLRTVKTTSVKDQNRSGTCWCFCTTSFIEDEIMRKGGDSLDLSEMFTVRNCYDTKAEKYVRRYGKSNFAGGGSAPDVLYVLRNFGAMPEEAYPGLNYGESKHDHGEFDAVLESFVQTIVKRPGKKVTTAWRPAFNGLLDAYLGEVPETFTYNGKTYTPQSFAASLGINPDDYIGITSYTHHPFYKPFAIEIADNWNDDLYQNVPLDELMAIVDNALENGYPVVWAADVSEGGFKWYDGVALMPKQKSEADMNGTELARWVKLSDKDRRDEAYNFTGPTEEIEVTQKSRQDMFDNQETMDDHGMELVGIAEDQNGNRYYKVKNSWDTNQIYDGFLYVSMPYFKAKTISVLLHKDAIPVAIAKKFKK